MMRTAYALQLLGLLLALLAPCPLLADELGMAISGTQFPYTVQPGDSLTGIGARFGMDPRQLAQDNDLQLTARLKPGQVLDVDSRHIVPSGYIEGLVINLPQRMLFHFVGAELRVANPVGLGRPNWPTPMGDFVVTSRERDKTWLVPPSIQREMARNGEPVLTRVPPGPDNPLGRHWLGLSIPGLGIHGTTAPQSIYHFQSHGCIRLHPDDIAALFDVVEKGTAGSLIYQPALLFVADDGRVYVEIHRDIYKKGVDAHKIIRELADNEGVSHRIDWIKADAAIAAHEGRVREVTLAAAGEMQ